MLSGARRLDASDKRARWGAESCYSLERLNYLSSLGDTRGGIRNHSSPKIILAVREIEGKSFFSCYLRVVGQTLESWGGSSMALEEMGVTVRG